MKNPFEGPAPPGWAISTIQICTADARLAMVRAADARDTAWLEQVLAWPGTQLTVQRAAQKRLARIRKEAA